MRILLLLLLLSMTAAEINEIAWTFSKPPANFFQWKTSKESPDFTMASLSPGNYVLQAIATGADGTSTHSGVLQGNITVDPQTIQLVMNPLIQADATRYQQPSYVKWVKTNTTTVYPGDIILLTIEGQSNPPNANMQYTIDQLVVCTTNGQCVHEYAVADSATDPFTLDISIVGMGYAIPMQLMVKPYVPVQFRAVFNTPPVITHINSAISLLHQIGAGTTVTATFADEDLSNVKYTWSVVAIQGSCPLSTLSGTLAGTEPSGSTVSVVFTPTTLGNKCIVQIRCEDGAGAVSLGEVYIYVDSIPIYFPPYVVSNFQSSQTGKIGDRVDVALELCEQQGEMVTTSWASSCGAVDHPTDIVIETTECFWVYNYITLASVPCSLTWAAVDSGGSVSTGKFRVLTQGRRLARAPVLWVSTTANSLKTSMVWYEHSPQEASVTDTMSGEGVALIVVLSMIGVSSIAALIVWNRRAVECVIPEEKMTEVTVDVKPQRPVMLPPRKTPNEHIKSIKEVMAKRPNHLLGNRNDINITPEMMARGAVKQMKMHNKKHARIEAPEHNMVDRPASPHAHGVGDSTWIKKVKRTSHHK